MPRAAKPKALDLKKLADMVPPFVLQLFRQKGQIPEPISLPCFDDSKIPGHGWSSEQIANIAEWVKGNIPKPQGNYIVKVVDSTMTTEQEWMFSIDRDLPQIPQPTEQIMSKPLFPPTPATYQTFQPPQPQYQPIPPNPFYPPPPQFYPAPAYPAPSPASMKDDYGALKDMMHTQEKAHQAAMHEAQLARLKDTHDRELRDIRAEVGALRAAVADRGGESNEAQIKLEMERMRIQHEREIMRLHMESSKKSTEVTPELIELRTQLAQEKADRRILELQINNKPDNYDKFERQIEALRVESARGQEKSHFEQQITALQTELRQAVNSKPDNTVPLMIEHLARSMDASKQADNAIIAMIQSKDAQTLAFLKEMVNKGDSNRVVEQTGKLLDMQMAVMQQHLAAQGGGGGLAILERGIDALSEVGARVVEGRAQAAQAEAQTKIAAHRSRAEMAQAQAVITQRAVEPTAGFSGPDIVDIPIPVSGEAEQPEQPVEVPEEQTAEHMQWGALYDKVKELRLEVRKGIDPEKTIEYILTAINVCRENPSLTPPALGLIEQGMIPDFFDKLLPRAPVEFKNKCIDLLQGIMHAGLAA